MDRDDLALVIASELQLHDPVVRRSGEHLSRLLANDFREVGASGRVWTRGDVIDELTATAPPVHPGAGAISVGASGAIC